MVAAFRGLAGTGDEPICNDPYALTLAGADGLAIAERYEVHYPHMRLWMGSRTRFLDELVVNSIAAGVRQIVLLGAGLDTRSARFSADGVRFFEVDHATSQASKRDRLQGIAGYPQDAAVYVTCDFEHDDFLDRLTASGLDTEQPALFVWEGVTYYLSEDDVAATASRIAAGCHPESRLAFDYAGKKMATGKGIRPEDEVVRDFVKDLGEPIRFGIDDVLPLMFRCGYRHVRTVSFDELAASYTGTYDRARAFRFQHIAVASRQAPPP